MVIDPLAAFLNWFDALPLDHRQRLAHLFFVCTTRDTSDMLATPRTSLARFITYFTGTDFPLRVVSRMFTVRTQLDLFLIHRQELVVHPENWIPGYSKNIMIPLDPYQWDKVYTSWSTLRSRDLSDPYLHTWAAAVLKKKQPEKGGTKPSKS